MVWGRAAGVSYEARDIDLDNGEVVEVEAPGPDAYAPLTCLNAWSAEGSGGQTHDDDEGNAIRQRQHPTEAIEMSSWLDRRVTVHVVVGSGVSYLVVRDLSSKRPVAPS